MLEKKRFWLSALAAALIAFLVAKGERVTQAIGAFVAALGAMDASTFGIVAGVFLGVIAQVITWVYKHKNHQLLKEQLEKGNFNSAKAILNEDDMQ
ncbi:hypothetical protein DBT73_RS21590 [Vibrio parahaemolyticus]|jgi:uncharacterized membrane protein|uniref:hypothetical protein n=1 Tax=unclassified Vibrio TaxID=2614977 RepID=UPI0023EAA3B4|nr:MULTISPECIES: hypothetical protein [unclassified Vibrio]EGR3042606.1 hypothetical protein [Vibrio parahaemolyticus]EJG0221692.1 hypothetical protein [Vibrio parahaemolyticus]EJG0231819.1 hypothetical protein [Vibrio parahaemolyticus]EJG0250864.1 hypothetical protein [Vibrio parahaemolyticus]EJG0388829.1 hypothetical protein [Vibrio parahaemolyticus]